MEITDVVGEFGPWQRVILFVTIFRAIPHSFLFMASPVFIPPLTYRCANEDYDFDNSTVHEQCSIRSGNETFPCRKWTYNLTEDKLSINMQFDLVCDQQWLESFVHISYVIGNVIGLFPGGNLADRFGRKPVATTGIVLMIAAVTAGIFSWTYSFFLITRSLLGFAAALMQNTTLCLYTETVGIQQRNSFILSFITGYGLGGTLLGIFSWILGNWKYIQTCGGILTFFLLLLFLIFVPESPRWLLTVGQDKRAEKVIEDAARRNKRLLVNREFIFEELKKKIEESKERQKVENICNIFRHRRYFKVVVFLSIALISNNFIYFFIHLNAANFGVGVHLTIILLSIFDIISTPIYFIMAKFLSRKKCILFNFFFAGIVSLGVLAIPNETNYAWVKICPALMVRTFINLNAAFLWIYSAELMPTSIRTSGVDCGWALSRMGAIAAPFTVLLCKRIGFQPLVLTSIVALLSGIAVIFIPETQQLNLADTLGEANKRLKIRNQRKELANFNQETRL